MTEEVRKPFIFWMIEELFELLGHRLSQKVEHGQQQKNSYHKLSPIKEKQDESVAPVHYHVLSRFNL